MAFNFIGSAIAALRRAILGEARVIAAFPIIEIGGGPTPFMPQVTVLEQDITKLQVALNDFHVPLEATLHQVVIPSIERHFDSEGPGWQQLAQSTIEKRGSSHPILQETGTLRSVATSDGIWNITRTELIGSGSFSGADYGSYHMSGTRNMPARPFIGLSEGDVNQISIIFNEWLGTEVRVVGGF